MSLYIHICISTLVLNFICVCVHIYMYGCICIYIYTFISLFVRVSVYKHTCLNTEQALMIEASQGDGPQWKLVWRMSLVATAGKFSRRHPTQMIPGVIQSYLQLPKPSYLYAWYDFYMGVSVNWGSVHIRCS